MDLKNSALPKILRDLRKEAGFTQEDLAPRLGLARETIPQLKTAGKKPLATSISDKKPCETDWWSFQIEYETSLCP